MKLDPWRFLCFLCFFCQVLADFSYKTDYINSQLYNRFGSSSSSVKKGVGASTGTVEHKRHSHHHHNQQDHQQQKLQQNDQQNHHYNHHLNQKQNHHLSQQQNHYENGRHKNHYDNNQKQNYQQRQSNQNHHQQHNQQLGYNHHHHRNYHKQDQRYEINSNHVDIRHSKHANSKFPHLEGVISRLDNIKNTANVKATTTENPKDLENDALTEEDYEDMDYGDNLDKLEDNGGVEADDIDDDDDGLFEDDFHDDEDVDNWEDNDADLEGLSDDDDYLDLDNLDETDEDKLDEDEEIEDVHFDSGYQAEEATHRPSPFTEYKWTHLSTKDGVDNYRNRLLFHTKPSTLSERDSALQHFVRMAEANCNKPMPRVVQVQTIHPNPSKTYMPHCTVLHRCGEDTGCCTGNDKKCGPKETEIVELYFLVREVSSQSGYINAHGKPEKLQFLNHTRCECMDKNSASESPRFARSEFSMRCKCPEMFKPFIRHNICTCDCSETDLDCNRMKKGKEHFSLMDRMKILNNQVTPPKCEYGLYDKTTGKCPRKEDRFEMYANVHEDSHF